MIAVEVKQTNRALLYCEDPTSQVSLGSLCTLQLFPLCFWSLQRGFLYTVLRLSLKTLSFDFRSLPYMDLSDEIS